MAATLDNLISQIGSVHLAETLLRGAASVVEPRPQLEIWEWAKDVAVLSTRVTRFPGPISFDHTPYMIGEWSPLWAYRRYQLIDNIWAAQTGKTLMLCLTVLYDVVHDPGPIMIVYPDRQTAVRRSRGHLRPLFEDSIPDAIIEGQENFQLTEYHLNSCSVLLAWAGSPSVLAGEPIKHLKLDEEAKFQGATAREADSKRLALRRLISYGEFANAFGCTTPSLSFLPGWRDWKNSTQCQRHVKCPKCGQWQVMYFGKEDRRWFDEDQGSEWHGGIKWDRDPQLSREDRIAGAYYECENRDCGDQWSTAKRNWLVQNGSEWIARRAEATKYASHLPSWYSQWVSFADIVGRWFDCYKGEDARHDFLNSDCAVPYEITGKQADAVELRQHILKGHHRGQVPGEAVAVYATFDVHDDHVRFRVRAWAPDLTSWGIEEGQLPPDLGVVSDFLAGRQYQGPDGTRGIDYALIDSGYRTDEVYQLCLQHHGRLWPCRGVPQLKEMVAYSRQSVIPNPGKGLLLGGVVLLVNANDYRWKDQLFSRLEIPPGSPGAWYVEEEASGAYFEQLTGEVKAEEQTRTGHPRFVWRQVGANHALDCEKMQLVATVAFQATAQKPAGDGEISERKPRKAGEDRTNPYTKREMGRRTKGEQ